MQGQLVYKYVPVKKEIKKCCSCHSFVSKDAKVCKRCGSSRFYVELQEYNLKIELTHLSKYWHPNPFYGRHHTKEAKEKIRKKRLGKKLDERVKHKLRELNRGERNPNYRGGGYKTCPICGSKFWVRPSIRERRKTCSKECDRIRRSMIMRKGKGLYPSKWKLLRGQIKKRDGYKCKICGSSEKLVVHHIDFNKENNHFSNLITVCRSCHNRIHRGEINVGEVIAFASRP